MWLSTFKQCRCTVKSTTKRGLPTTCPEHGNEPAKVLETPPRPSKEKRRAWYKKNSERIAKDRKKNGYTEYQASYHPGWVAENRETWNRYQREWRAKQRGSPMKPRFAPGKRKALMAKYGVAGSTIDRWIKKGKIKVKKDYP